MNVKFALCLLPLLAGCLTASVPDVSHWMLRYEPVNPAGVEPRYDVVRVAHVLVRAPCREKGIVVYRADGSVALDPYNEYIAEPALLLRGVAADALTCSGLFRDVVPSTSLAKSSVTVEVGVKTLALDCRERDVAARKAVADLYVQLVDSSGVMLKTTRGSSSVVVGESDFGKALSLAFSQALEQAVAGLK